MLTPETLRAGDDLYVRFNSGWVHGDVSAISWENNTIDFSAYDKGYLYTARLNYSYTRARWTWDADPDGDYVVDVANSWVRDAQTAAVAAEIGSQEWADELVGWKISGSLSEEIFIMDLIIATRKPIT